MFNLFESKAKREERYKKMLDNCKDEISFCKQFFGEENIQAIDIAVAYGYHNEYVGIFLKEPLNTEYYYPLGGKNALAGESINKKIDGSSALAGYDIYDVVELIKYNNRRNIAIDNFIKKYPDYKHLSNDNGIQFYNKNLAIKQRFTLKELETINSNQ